MKSKIAIVTEADEYVASGHLKECIVLAKELQKRMYDVSFWVNEDILKGFLKGVPDRCHMYCRPVETGIEKIIAYIKQEKVQLLVFNLRSIENSLILKIKHSCDVQILCIDEFGHRRLDCHIIVNPMIDVSYGQYQGDFHKKFVGGQYLILPKKYSDWHQNKRDIRKNIEKFVISMGGVDRNNTTKKIVRWMQRQSLKNVEIKVVLGAGYSGREELEQLAGGDNIRFYQNITFLDELFFESDLAFCAGGNTLHELACIGTPTVVIPSMPHEYQNGKAFEIKGFGKCYRTFEEFQEQTKGSFLSCFGQQERRMQSMAGRACADGKGYLRVLKIIEDACFETKESVNDFQGN